MIMKIIVNVLRLFVRKILDNYGIKILTFSMISTIFPRESMIQLQPSG